MNKNQEQFKKSKNILTQFNSNEITLEQAVQRIIKTLGFKVDDYNEMEVGDYLMSQVQRGRIRVEDKIIVNIIELLD
jgi:hypothetical protein